MSIVNVTGLPESCQLPYVIYFFKNTLKKKGISNFWITEISQNHSSDLKNAKIEFTNSDEAYRAVRALDGIVNTIGEFQYPMTARLVGKGRVRPRRRSPSPTYEHDYRNPRYEESYDGYGHRFSRERSRSPVGRELHEASKLDIEIELLKKQRMIIEEERRLLLERKKLELVKEFGPSAYKEVRSLEEDRDRRYRPERPSGYRPERPSGYRPERPSGYRPERPSGYRPRRPSPPLRPRAPPLRPARPVRNEGFNQLPQFLLPCKIILGQLKELMEKLGTKKESFLLNKQIRSTIRKRLAVALEGRPIMSGAKIVDLYREKYPQTLDEKFVEKHLSELRSCHLPAKSKELGKEKAEKKPKTEKAEENNHVEKNVDPDTAHSDNAKVKTEPNTSTEELISENLEAAVVEGASIGSGDALALHDKNDEDWAVGEDWDDVPSAEPTEA